MSYLLQEEEAYITRVTNKLDVPLDFARTPKLYPIELTWQEAYDLEIAFRYYPRYLKGFQELVRLLKKHHLYNEEIAWLELTVETARKSPYETEKALNALSEREQDIIRKRYGLGESRLNLEYIAKKWNLSRERIRQIEAKALQRMKKWQVS